MFIKVAIIIIIIIIIVIVIVVVIGSLTNYRVPRHKPS